MRNKVSAQAVNSNDNYNHVQNRSAFHGAKMSILRDGLIFSELLLFFFS